uniref:Uncharacterized protein n=1 Tax=Pseudo-nitzschia australis TaxID=44445 RepID=A0A7S4ALM6_9STRA|mmetsp:Transcript_27052/g.59502  ORF Transcript_27052/g.59502 Transcript_27052/m.59502 type:complete len:179 (+) Transcript_27052:213-749(+)
MMNFRTSFCLLSSILLSCHRSASAFLMTTANAMATAPSNAPSNARSPTSSLIFPKFADATFFVLHAGFEQLPGESSTAFIKRITSQSGNFLEEQNSKTRKLTSPSSRKNSTSNYSSGNDEESDEAKKPIGKYQSIEDWDAEQKEKGVMSWEEKVQFDGQRFGNQLKQDKILSRHLGTF